MAEYSKAHVTYCDIYHVSDSISLPSLPEGSAYVLSPGLRQDYLMPAVLPSFLSRGISRTHALEVIAGFSANDQTNVQVGELQAATGELHANSFLPVR